MNPTEQTEADHEEREQLPTTKECCSAQEQSTCCAPQDKAACCGAAAAGKTCGCR